MVKQISSSLIQQVTAVLVNSTICDREDSRVACDVISKVAEWLHDNQYWENASAVLEAELEDFYKTKS
jgi:hypothetical protein